MGATVKSADSKNVGTTALGWRDIMGPLFNRGTPAPMLATFLGGIQAFSFPKTGHALSLQSEYHVDHDYAPGTNVFLHVHWATASSDVAAESTKRRTHRHLRGILELV